MFLAQRQPLDSQALAAATGTTTAAAAAAVAVAAAAAAGDLPSCQESQKQQKSPAAEAKTVFATPPTESSLLEYVPPIPTVETEATSMGSASSKIRSSANRESSSTTHTSKHSHGKNIVRALSSKRKALWEKKSPPSSSSGGAAPRPHSNSTTARAGSPPKAGRKASVSTAEGSVGIGPSTVSSPTPPKSHQPEPVQSPLTTGDLVRLFSGAPQFSLYAVTAETNPTSSHYTHLPLIPTVTFPYAPSEAHIPPGSDHISFPLHPSFSSCSSSHSSRGEIDTLDPLSSELPPMPSFQGLELGTCGWEHYVLAPLGDANNETEEDPEGGGEIELDEGGHERGVSVSTGGLAGVMRSVEVSWVVERLKELGELYWIGRLEGDKVEGIDCDEGEANESATRTVIDSSTPTLEEGLTQGNITDGNTATSNGKPGILSKYTHLELYTNLFTQLLYPPTKITTADYHDPYSLRVQIASLTHALGMPRVWLDFSLVEWRIQLGQVLWGQSWTPEDITGVGGTNTERVWLLLQILLACELVMRLDAVAATDFDEGGVGGSGETKEEMFGYFRQIRKKKVEWDILLARRWLENVVLVERESTPLSPLTIPEHSESPSVASSPVKKKGWFSSLSSSPPPTSSGTSPMKYDPTTARSNNPAYDALIIPRDQATQLSGLLYFAREINWPHVEVLSQALVDNLLRYVQTHPAKYGYSLPLSVSSTPLPVSPGMLTPGSEPAGTPNKGKLAAVATAIPNNTGSYFTMSSLRPKRLRDLSSRSSLRSKSSSLLMRKRDSVSTLMRNNTMGSGGWLSRSWFTGLVLPGESMPHLLISALLENDINVGERVGWEAELYGGFILSHEDGGVDMWWSSFCIVGRVLGGYGGGKECMGWIGAGKVKLFTAQDVGESGDDWCAGGEGVTGWIAVVTKPTVGEDEHGDVDAPTVERVDKPREVGKTSCILGRTWKEGIALLEEDFVIPTLGEAYGGVELKLEGLVFKRGEKVGFTSDEEDQHAEEEAVDGVEVYDVSMSFLLTEKPGELLPHTGTNTTVEAHPRKIFHLNHDVTFITAYPCLPPATTFPSPTAPQHHPLHRSHRYTVHPLSSLPTLSAPEQFFSSKPGETSLELMNRARKAIIMVIDASGTGEDGGVFAKAWCADRGVNAALIQRRRRGCVSCAVREAAGLAVPVVIWMDD